MTRQSLEQRAQSLGKALARSDLTASELQACYAELREIHNFLVARYKERREIAEVCRYG
jgi:hypothetical protein